MDTAYTAENSYAPSWKNANANTAMVAPAEACTAPTVATAKARTTSIELVKACATNPQTNDAANPNSNNNNTPNGTPATNTAATAPADATTASANLWKADAAANACAPSWKNAIATAATSATVDICTATPVVAVKARTASFEILKAHPADANTATAVGIAIDNGIELVQTNPGAVQSRDATAGEHVAVDQATARPATAESARGSNIIIIINNNNGTKATAANARVKGTTARSDVANNNNNNNNNGTPYPRDRIDVHVKKANKGNCSFQSVHFVGQFCYLCKK